MLRVMPTTERVSRQNQPEALRTMGRTVMKQRLLVARKIVQQGLVTTLRTGHTWRPHAPDLRVFLQVVSTLQGADVMRDRSNSRIPRGIVTERF